MKVRDEVFKYYFYFMQERMNIFWKRYNGETSRFTEDDILSTYKFTNVYRVLDRVSQYLVKEVIYVNNEPLTEQDILFRIIIFKIFNNIQTWQYLQEKLGVIKVSTFNVSRFSELLSERIKSTPVFNAAYIMNGSHIKYNLLNSKHEKWLSMVEQEMITEKRFEKIIKAASLGEVYDILSECSFIGSFLAYQYAIDLNYSPVINFNENSFVKAGVGAIRGIKKCFVKINKSNYEDCIKYTHDNLQHYQERYGYTDFKSLFSREPTLIDLQNCFCETDKYLRVKLPGLQVDNTRIKQKFSLPKPAINYFFPPKWQINEEVDT